MRGATVVLLAGLEAGCAPQPPSAPATLQLTLPDDETGAGWVRCGSEVPYDRKHGCLFHPDGTPLRVALDNRMSDGFRLVGAAVFVDGVVVFEANDAALLASERVVMFDGGTRRAHTIAALLRFRGHGHGVFSYLKGYRFDVRSSCRLRPASPATDVTVTSYERGGETTPLEDRPAIRWTIQHGDRSGSCQPDPQR
jgi:hypothetical protein